MCYSRQNFRPEKLHYSISLARSISCLTASGTKRRLRVIKESSVVISIPNDVEYYLGKKRLRKEQLADEVQRMLEKIKNEPDRIVYIKSGVGVTYGVVVNVINEVRKVGVDKIGLVADKKNSTTANTAPTASS